MRLTEAQALNPLWIEMRKYYADRLLQLQSENNNLSLGEKETAVLRGRIAECKALLDMDSPEPEDISVAGM